MRGLIVAAALLPLLVLGCPQPSQIKPDKNSGPDQSWDTPTELTLEGEGDTPEELEAEASDSVSYPGGDRVDWRFLELPADGTLKISLAMQPARPGLAIGMQVLDDGFRVLSSRTSDQPSLEIKLKDSEAGRYYIQVYAPRRGDAAIYDLSVSFRKGALTKDDLVDATTNKPLFDKDLLPDPEPLPAVPEPVVPSPSPTGPPGVVDAGVAMPPQQVDAGMKPDAAVRPPPIIVEVVDSVASPNGTLITVQVGKLNKIDKTWKGTLLLGRTDKPLRGGAATIKMVLDRTTQLEVRLSLDDVRANPRIRLEAP